MAGMDGERERGREERAELWHYPQPFLQRVGVRTQQTEPREEGRGIKQ